MLEDILGKTPQGVLYNQQKFIKEINNLESSIKPLSNEELRAKTLYFKALLKRGKTLNDILPEAFAVVREASFRVLGLRHYDVQLIGGYILHDGNIAEMKTGEGKTLVAILPAYLNALTEKSVHIVTVNEYLAKRDSLSVGKVISFLDLKVGLILADMNRTERKRNYSCDVVYSTNSELGFDYLRDNMVGALSDKVQNGFDFAIVDEVDSVLIDEARTPLIISQSFETLAATYLKARSIALSLKKDVHYEIDKKNRNIYLTEEGTRTVQVLLGVSSIYKFEHPWALYILNAIRANELYKINKDYLVLDNQICIVDEFTGRILPGRRWGENLHQAIEAKEGLDIDSESITIASITYQNLFLFYKKLSGMTGTAATEEREFKRIYDLSVYCVPTNKKINRIDKEDVVYNTFYAKWKAVLYEALAIHKQGRPILIGTSNVESSEIISDLLLEYDIEHYLLNAKPENAANESAIIAQAGRQGAVTIATNMAGRGTDILLGGNANFLAKNELREIIASRFNIEKNRKFNSELINRVKNKYNTEIRNIRKIDEFIIENIDEPIQEEDSLEKALQNLYIEIKIYYDNKCRVEKEEVIRLGGLHIIGTEKHESRRIDNQLRGRAGRQGDPGSSKFFLSFEDNLLQVFASDKLQKMIKELDLGDTNPVEGRLITLGIIQAQKKIENKNYEIRKRLFNYDNVLSIQRKVIYDERDKFLNLTDLKNVILQYLEKSVDDVMSDLEKCESEKSRNIIIESFCKKFICLPYEMDKKLLERMTKENIKKYLNDQVKISYELKELELDSLQVGLSESIEYAFLLQAIDQSWKQQLARMDLLKESIGWRSYGQRDPLLEYQKEAYDIFTTQTVKIRHSASHLIMCSTSFA